MLLDHEELGVSEETLTRAEALVAAAIGTKSLEQRTVTQAGAFAGGVIPLKDGPAVSVSEFLLSGYPVAPSVFPWFLDLGLGRVLPNPYAGGYGMGTYAVTYRAGWTESNVPEAVRQAVLLTAEALQADAQAASGDALTKLRTDEGEFTFAQPTAAKGSSGLPVAVDALLLPYLPLRF